MNLFSGVNQINFRVKEIDRASKWYQEILGLAVKHDYGTTVVLAFDEHSTNPSTLVCLIELAEGEDLSDNGANGTHPVFAISEEQAEQCREQLISKGVNVLEGSKAHFKFTDPDGNLMEAYLPGLYEEKRFAHLR
ncbi:VOC family protein [Pseudalkalibacillus caeni]|uniref:VOC domain-containing protein n=1 Tax=Exobacillus caeni TaxID=2574798 RepID=A0A5R9FBC2_9BACL|nr:VOC family protein [Pseudalkalibacillus caeni]TLS36925.1 hypothetical protein FCL54_13290 [Pseudalkalibacillus caeni]